MNKKRKTKNNKPFFIFLLSFLIVLFALFLTFGEAKAEAWWGEGYRDPEWVRAHGGTIVNFSIVAQSEDSDKYRSRMYKNGDMVEIEYGKKGHFDDAYGGGVYTIIAFRGTDDFAKINITACKGGVVNVVFNEKKGMATSSGCLGGFPKKPVFQFKAIEPWINRVNSGIYSLNSWFSSEGKGDRLIFIKKPKKEQNHHSEGIWMYDFDKNKEIQLVSYEFLAKKELGSEKYELEGQELISKNGDFIVFKLGTREKSFGLWIYEVDKKQLTNISKSLNIAKKQSFDWNEKLQGVIYLNQTKSGSGLYLAKIGDELEDFSDFMKFKFDKVSFLDNKSVLLESSKDEMRGLFDLKKNVFIVLENQDNYQSGKFSITKSQKIVKIDEISDDNFDPGVFVKGIEIIDLNDNNKYYLKLPSEIGQKIADSSMEYENKLNCGDFLVIGVSGYGMDAENLGIINVDSGDFFHIEEIINEKPKEIEFICQNVDEEIILKYNDNEDQEFRTVVDISKEEPILKIRSNLSQLESVRFNGCDFKEVSQERIGDTLFSLISVKEQSDSLMCEEGLFLLKYMEENNDLRSIYSKESGGISMTKISGIDDFDIKLVK